MRSRNIWFVLALILILVTKYCLGQELVLQGNGWRKTGVHLGGGRILTSYHSHTGQHTLQAWPDRDQRVIYLRAAATAKAASSVELGSETHLLVGSQQKTWRQCKIVWVSSKWIKVWGQVEPGDSGRGVYTLDGYLVGTVSRPEGPWIMVARY